MQTVLWQLSYHDMYNRDNVHNHLCNRSLVSGEWTLGDRMPALEILNAIKPKLSENHRI